MCGGGGGGGARGVREMEPEAGGGGWCVENERGEKWLSVCVCGGGGGTW